MTGLGRLVKQAQIDPRLSQFERLPRDSGRIQTGVEPTRVSTRPQSEVERLVGEEMDERDSVAEESQSSFRLPTVSGSN